MIRNIVLDLGNVLLSWKPYEFLLKSGYSSDDASEAVKIVFGSQAWKELDNGDISKKEAIDIMASGSPLKRVQIISLFDLCPKIIFPLQDNIKLLPGLKKQGFRLYYLSNYPLDFFNETKKLFDFFNDFDGGIISAEVHRSKPDPVIYKLFLERFGLSAGECLYIDDMEINARSAEAAGMIAVHLSDHGSLRTVLAKFVDF